MRNRIKILNLWIDPVDMDQALSRVRQFVEKGDRPHSVFAVNPEKNFSVPKDPFLYKTFKTADLLIPDGIGMVLAVKILYDVKLTRVPGVELMANICEMSAKNRYKIFVYGAREEVNKTAVLKLQERYHGLEIVGRANGYLRDEEMASLVTSINKSGAEILFLALGSPKQEKWFETYGSYLESVRVCQGIGGTLDSIAGSFKRAPEVWQSLGLEWFYRSVADPKRITRARSCLLFGAMVMFEKVKRSPRLINME